MEKKRWLKGIGLLAGLALFLAAVVFLIRPDCPILRFTGFYCAGCGGQRMVHSLLRGDFSAAFHHNPYLFVLCPLAAVYAVVEVCRYGKGKRLLIYSRRFRWCLIAVLALGLLFTVLRNLPGFSFLVP